MPAAAAATSRRSASVRRQAAARVAGPVGIDALESAQNFDDRIGTVRGFTRDNPARAALAVRDMIKADAK